MPAKKNFFNDKKKKEIRKIARNEISKQLETKVHQIGFPPTAFSDVGVISNITSIPRGDADGMFDGNNMLPLSVRLCYRIINGDDNNLARIVMLRWNASSTPVLNDFLDAALTGTDRIYNEYATVNRKEFNILYDKYHTLHTAGKSNVFVNTTIKLGKRKCYFPDGSQTNGEGMIYLLLLSDSANVTHPSFEGCVTLRYRDA